VSALRRLITYFRVAAVLLTSVLYVHVSSLLGVTGWCLRFNDFSQSLLRNAHFLPYSLPLALSNSTQNKGSFRSVSVLPNLSTTKHC